MKNDPAAFIDRRALWETDELGVADLRKRYQHAYRRLFAACGLTSTKPRAANYLTSLPVWSIGFQTDG
jgi:hypothetical protein